MFKKIMPLLFLLLAFFSFTQKELTLSESILQQYRAFYPQQPVFFQWIPNTDAYTYLENYTSLIQSRVKDQTNLELMTIAELNKIADVQFNWFSNFKWINEHEFVVDNGTVFLKVNPQEKQAKIIHQLEEDAQRATWTYASDLLAYTIDNNIFISYPNTQTREPVAEQITFFSDKNIVSGQEIARSEFGISNGLFWSNDGKVLAFYQKDETEVHDYPLLDINTTPGTLKSIKYPMAGQLSEKPRVGIYDTQTKQTIYISPRANADDYLTNLSFTPDNKFILLAEVNRDQDHMWLNVYEVATGKFVRTLLEETNTKWVEPEHPAFFPDQSSNNFVWISEKNGFNNLYYYDIQGNLIRQLTDNQFAIDEIIEFTKGRVYFYATGANPLNKVVFSVDLKGNQILHTPLEGTHQFVLSPSASFFYDGYSNHTTPFEANIYTIKGKVAKHLLTAPNPLSDYRLGATEIGTLTAEDGSTLYTRLIKPSNFDPSQKYPVLIYVYGGPHAQMITNSWYSGSSLWMNWLAEQGYLVFTLDNRGSARRGFAFESQIHRQLGQVEMRDQFVGVNYLKSLDYVDGDRLAVHGWSFGGFMTASLLLHYPDIFKAGVAGGPVTDWKFYEIMYGERYMDTPDQNPEGYKQTSLLTHAKNLKDHLLLIHGTVDDVVVMQHNFALVKEMVENGIQVDFFPYPMHPHNVRGKDRVHLMEKVLHYILMNNTK